MMGRLPGLQAWARLLWCLPILALGATGLERERDVHAAEPRSSSHLLDPENLGEDLAEDGGQEGRSTVDRERLLERWRSLTDEQRVALRERYRRFRDLDADQRELLVQGGRRLDDLAHDIEAALMPAERKRLDRLSPRQRRAELRMMAAESARDLGQQVLQRLSENQRHRFESANLSDRLRFLTRYRQQQETELGRVLLDLADLMHISEKDKERLGAIPPQVARQRLIGMLRRFAQDQAERLNAEQPISDQSWRRLSEMRGPEFMHAMLRLRSQHPELWPRLGPQPESFDPDWERIRLRLRLAMRPLPGEHISLLDLPRAELEEEKRRRRRERILDIFAQENLMDADDQAFLRELPPMLFVRVVRRVMRHGVSEDVWRGIER